ncbi:flagellar biosynthesis protein FlhF [Microaerobacter geothermalis]|uniref:flagellar biosynthesis protein FlhF n=1 Tax=Microaerobacter geothermalis TaxID=674972 RepID=UPI001EFFC002|nr:flagellar biosynthesis protein FlhF [Microaerobacter geothermalis]MCF6093819.1 flagellar biosynthesis protein FlhF [Microaerobacter geothermalis]
MRIKRYVVDSMPDALQKIKEELGKEAIILNTKKIKTGGFLGLFTRQKIEVIAAVDPSGTEKRRSPVYHSKTLNDEVPAQKTEPKSTNPFSFLQSEEEPSVSNNHESLIQEIKDMRGMFLKLLLQEKNYDKLPLPIRNISRRLKDQEVNEGIISYILEQLLKKVENVHHISSDEVYQLVKNEIEKLLKKGSPVPIRPHTKFVNFIGPTGVGKTTTIAKLAAESVLKDRKKVGLITSDTYRIAAVDQLKTYANILNVSLEVVFSASELHQSLNRLKDCDIVFMDTAGRNYLNKSYVKELGHLLTTTVPNETYLVLSLTSKYQDMVSIANNFKQINIDKVIFTKADETSTYGAILNLVHQHNFSLSYLTNGQNVPDDILIASETRVANLILGEDGHA